MPYIIKNTSGLVNTRVTDVGRRKISQGNFNISYFQIGDSEVSYTAVPGYNIVNNNILMPAFNAQNDTGVPQSNKENVKYVYYVEGNTGNTYGIPYEDSVVDYAYNNAGSKGFFNTGLTTTWVVENTSAYTVTSNYWIDMGTLSGQTEIDIEYYFCSITTGAPQINDFITIYFDGDGTCNEINTVPVLTYKIQNISGYTIVPGITGYTVTLDRRVPDYSSQNLSGYYGRVHIYPSGMTQLYDTIVPFPYWQIDTINFESPCDVQNRENTPIWNMNIPWTESPAGLFSRAWENYTKFGSEGYVGTKELLGYNEPSGQTDTSEVFYYNSFDEKIVLSPSDQKTIAIIHYTNNDIDFVYGEKFATVPFDPQNPTDDTGLARHFKLSLPTLMWHKSTGTTIGADFYIDPVNYDLCYPYYIKSKVNSDMNDPGIRYFHLWDSNPDDNNNLNRVGKVFPDQQIVIFDDEEIVAAISNKSNRNWTLPAPKLSLITPNTCFNNNSTATGIMTNSSERMWVTYRLDNESGFTTNNLHCNYYQVITGPDTGCTTTSQNVAVRFGPEFKFLSQGGLTGYSSTKLQLICQKVVGDSRPDPTRWVIIDVTDQLSATTVNGYLTMSGITGTTFEISLNNYTNTTPIYQLHNYMDLAPNGSPDILNFGDEYYFYGNLQTDIAATIYEMRYLITLNNNQFTNTSNPTWTSGTTSYVTEIGLYNDDKELLVLSKLQSPEVRQGIQQFVVKLDF
jgi:hypothetical protein